MEQKTIKWGIIGLGKIANKFATDLTTVSNSKLHAVASRSAKKSKEFSKKYGVEKTYNSYESLAKDDEIDAVYIATPHSFHKEHTILCLQHKKAVLCEKPFAMNLTEVKQMIALAKQNNVLLMEALWTYFLPHITYVLDIVNQKTFGELLELHTDFGFKAKYDLKSRLIKKEVGGGSLLDIGIYPVFMALSTLGVPKQIDAKATFFETGADSECNMTFNYQNGTAKLKSTLLKETKTEAIFTFEKAVVKINKRFHEPSTVTILKDNSKKTIDFKYSSIGYNFEIEHFNHLLREGKKESDVMSFDFSLKLIKTIDDIRELIGLEYESF